jgi:ankyrin repeat protein
MERFNALSTSLEGSYGGQYQRETTPLDLAVANGSTTSTSVLLKQGDGNFAAAVNYTVSYGPTSIAAADLNGDGKPDLAITNHATNNVRVLLNTCLP